MNRTEDTLMIRLYSVFNDIPLPVNGASLKTDDVSGFLSFGKDMAELKPVIENAMYHIRVGEFDAARRELILAERYVQIRRQQDWGYVFPHPSIRDGERTLEKEEMV